MEPRQLLGPCSILFRLSLPLLYSLILRLPLPFSPLLRYIPFSLLLCVNISRYISLYRSLPASLLLIIRIFTL